jgi:MYXO-CTERM domain-containing protein
MGRLASVLLVLAAVIPASALAQEDCEGGDLARRPIELTPSSGASGVTTDAPIIVRYSSGYFGPAGPGDPPETLIQVGLCPLDDAGNVVRCEEAAPIEGSVQVIGDRLVFVPTVELAANRYYAGLAIGVDMSLPLTFRTGFSRDAGPPTVGALVRAEPERTGPSCPWVPEGGQRIGFVFGAADDDGPLGSIEYLLYLTRGADVTAPQLRDRFRNSGETPLPLLLTDDEAAEPVCVRVFAVDGVGNVSEPSPEHCVDPATGAAFQGMCTVSGAGAGRSTSAPWALAIAVAIALVSRRRR